MESSKLNDWLQIAAAVGVIAGLVLVAYEIRVSNRIGYEQASAASWERWDSLQQLGTSREIADLFVRANEGDELSRTEAVMLNNYIDQVIAAVSYDLFVNETQPTADDYLVGTVQLYVSNDYFQRRWTVLRNLYDGGVVAKIDQALAAPRQRDILAYLDFIRGATDVLE